LGPRGIVGGVGIVGGRGRVGWDILFKYGDFIMTGMTRKESELFLKVFELLKSKNLELSIKPIDVGWRIVLSNQKGPCHISEGMLFQILRGILEREL